MGTTAVTLSFLLLIAIVISTTICVVMYRRRKRQAQNASNKARQGAVEENQAGKQIKLEQQRPKNTSPATTKKCHGTEEETEEETKEERERRQDEQHTGPEEEGKRLWSAPRISIHWLV